MIKYAVVKSLLLLLLLLFSLLLLVVLYTCISYTYPHPYAHTYKHAHAYTYTFTHTYTYALASRRSASPSKFLLHSSLENALPSVYEVFAFRASNSPIPYSRTESWNEPTKKFTCEGAWLVVICRPEYTPHLSGCW